MVVTRRSGYNDPERPSASDDEICWIAAAEVAKEIQGAIPEVFGSIKTTTSRSIIGFSYKQVQESQTVNKHFSDEQGFWMFWEDTW